MCLQIIIFLALVRNNLFMLLQITMAQIPTHVLLHVDLNGLHYSVCIYIEKHKCLMYVYIHISHSLNYIKTWKDANNEPINDMETLINIISGIPFINMDELESLYRQDIGSIIKSGMKLPVHIHTFEVWVCISNFIPWFTGHVIPYPWMD